MNRRFLVEAKAFVFSVIEGASVLRVEESRKFYSGAVLLSNQCIEWLVPTMEVLMGGHGLSDFVKSFREGVKVTIVRIGGNTNGRFVEVAVYGVGVQRGFLRIPEGRGGWGWLKFLSELRKALDLLGTAVGCGFGGSSPEEKSRGKEVGVWLGKAAGPLSFAEAVRSTPNITAFEGRNLVSQVEAAWCEEQFPLKERSCAIVRQAVDCYAWEKSLLDPAGKDLCGVGSNVRKVRKCSIRDSDVSVCRKILERVGVWLDWVSGSNVGWSRSYSVGLKMGRCRIASAVLRRPRCRDGSRKLGSKPNPKKAKRFLPDKVCGLDEARLDYGISGLGSSAPEAVDGSSSTSPGLKSGSSLMGGYSPVEIPEGSRSEKMTTGMGGGLSDFGEFPSVCTAVTEDTSVCAAKPNMRLEVSVCDLTPCLIGGLKSGSKGFEFPSLGADALGERIRLSLPVMTDSGAPIYPSETKSVMRYQRKSKAKASKLDISLIEEAVTALSSPMTQSLGTSQALDGSVVQNLPLPSGGVGLRRGFLLPRVPSPLSDCKSKTGDKGETPISNGLIQSQEWPVGFSPSGEIVLWEQGEKGDSPNPLGVIPPDLLLEWESDGAEDEDSALALLDNIEEEFHRDNMGKRHKIKGRRELQNLKSSINYDGASVRSWSRRGKAQVL